MTDLDRLHLALCEVEEDRPDSAESLLTEEGWDSPFLMEIVTFLRTKPPKTLLLDRMHAVRGLLLDRGCVGRLAPRCRRCGGPTSSWGTLCTPCAVTPRTIVLSYSNPTVNHVR